MAVAIGETLEDVWRMPDVERMQLIEVLGLGQVARPVAEEDVGQGGHHEVTVADATKGVGQENGHKEQVQERKGAPPRMWSTILTSCFAAFLDIPVSS